MVQGGLLATQGLYLTFQKAIIASKHSCIKLSCKYLQFYNIFGELIVIGMRQNMVDKTVDSILVKEGTYMWTLPDHQGGSLKWPLKFLLKHTTFYQNLEISLIWIKNFPMCSIHFWKTSLKWKQNLPDALLKLITCMRVGLKLPSYFTLTVWCRNAVSIKKSWFHTH